MNTLEGKIVLVTGATGFIGAHLTERLSNISGVKLLLLSRQPRQTVQQNVVWLKSQLNQLTPEYWASHDISHIDYVFHLGAFIPKMPSDANLIAPAVDDNISGTRMLLQSLPKTTAKLIFSGTIDVYAPLVDHDATLTERARTEPDTLYGASKLFCESLISTWAKQRNCEYAILRYGHIYGPGEDQYRKLIPVVIRNLLSRQAPVLHGDGSALRDYLYVGDAIEATIRAALIKGNIDPLNIVRGKSVTLKDIVQLLIRLIGSYDEINYFPDKPNGTSYKFDNSRMEKIIGDWPKTHLTEGLAAEIAAFRRLLDE